MGPGNAYVAEAKLQLVSQVTIDSPAGPSELLVIADDSASPRRGRARDDRAGRARPRGGGDHAGGGLRTGNSPPMRSPTRSIGHSRHWWPSTPRAAIVRAALGVARRAARDHVASLSDAIAFANDWAAEHLLLAVQRRRRSTTTLAALRHAGTIFVGESASVAFGDYMTGANHVLPTAGLARCYSGLSTLDFVRWTTWQRVTPAAAASLARRRGRLRRRRGTAGARRRGARLGNHLGIECHQHTDRLAIARAAYRDVPLYDPQACAGGARPHRQHEPVGRAAHRRTRAARAGHVSPSRATRRCTPATSRRRWPSSWRCPPT